MKETIHFFKIDISDRHLEYLTALITNDFILKNSSHTVFSLLGSYTVIRQKMLSYKYASIPDNKIELKIVAAAAGLAIDEFHSLLDSGADFNLFIKTAFGYSTPEVQESFELAMKERNRKSRSAAKRRKKDADSLDADEQSSRLVDGNMGKVDGNIDNRDRKTIGLDGTLDTEKKRKEEKRKEEKKNTKKECVIFENELVLKTRNEILSFWDVLSSDENTISIVDDKLKLIVRNGYFEKFRFKFSNFRKHIANYPQYKGKCSTYMNERWSQQDFSLKSDRTNLNRSNDTINQRHPSYKKINFEENEN